MAATLAVGADAGARSSRGRAVTPPPPYPGLPGPRALNGDKRTAAGDVELGSAAASRVVTAHRGDDSSDDGGDVAGGAGGERVEVPATLLGEAKEQLWLAWPVIVAYLLQMSMGVVNLMMVGHVKDHDTTFAAGASHVPRLPPATAVAAPCRVRPSRCTSCRRSRINWRWRASRSFAVCRVASSCGFVQLHLPTCLPTSLGSRSGSGW